MSKYCEVCGAEVLEQARFCMHCGAQLKSSKELPAIQSTPPSSEIPDLDSTVASIPPGDSSVSPTDNHEQVPVNGATAVPAPQTSPETPATPEEQIPIPPPLMNTPGIQQIASADLTSSPPATVSGTRVLNELLNNRYRIVRMLGEGGMGAVYLAEDTTLFNKKCIVKEMLPYYSNDQEKREAESFFVREVQVLAGLSHPGIPQISDHFINNDHYYYVMEYVEGETLTQRSQRMGGRLNENDTLEYARQIAEILDYISSRAEPVIHRDVKPDNIILDNVTGKVKLVDFGLAKTQNTRAQMSGKSSALGTPGYAPPEQYQGNAQPWTDIYALGATMHHLLSGVDPRNANTPFQFDPLRRINPSITSRTEDLVRRMLEINPTARPNAKQLKQLLASGGLPPQNPPSVGGIYPAPGPVAPGGIPGLPFNFRSGLAGRNPIEISQICERGWDEGVYHLYQGDFEPWFQVNSLHQLAQASLAIRQRTSDRNAGLEEFLHALNPTLPAPILSCQPTTINLGTIEKGARQLVNVEIINAGRGYLYGSVRSLAPWLNISSQRIGVKSGGKQVIQAEISTNQLDTGSVQTSAIEINSNGGTAFIDLSLDIIWPPHLKVINEVLQLGEIRDFEKGQLLSKGLALRNDGGGILQGEIQVREPWISLAAGQSNQLSLSSGESIVVQIVGNTTLIPAYRMVHGAVTVVLPTGPVDIPVKMGIKKGYYELPQRIFRWTGYVVSLFMAMLSWSYTLVLISRWLMYNSKPIIFKNGILGNIFINAFNKLYMDLKLYSMQVSSDIQASILLLITLIFLGFIFFFIARRFIHGLDEIELYYDPNLATTYPQWQANSRLILWLRLAVFIGATGCIWGSLRNEVGLIAGVIVGALLGLFAVTPGYRPTFWQQICVVLAMTVIGFIASNSTLQASVWGIYGFLVIPNLNSKQPIRWRWLEATLRPILFAGIVCLIGVGLGQVVWGKHIGSLDSYYLFRPIISTTLAIMMLIWCILGIGGYILAIKTETLLDEVQEGIGKVFWVLFIFDTLAGILSFVIIRAIVYSLYHSYPSTSLRWVVFALTIAASGAVAYYAMRKKNQMQRVIVETLHSLSFRSGYLKLPQKIGNIQQKFASRLQHWLGSAPLEGLTFPTAIGTVLLGAFIIPYLTTFLWSSIRLVLVIFIPLAFVSGFVYFLVKRSRV